jgi:uncharacterized protein
VRNDGYRVDLSAHLADCEMNYLRLRKLLPADLSAGETLRYAIGGSEMHFEVLECAPYTTMLSLQLLRPRCEHWPSMTLQLRVYHDAAVAEVVGGERPKPFLPRYNYPNRAMHHRDEKAQLNTFLGEWLSRCLSGGHRVDAMPQSLFEA